MCRSKKLWTEGGESEVGERPSGSGKPKTELEFLLFGFLSAFLRPGGREWRVLRPLWDFKARQAAKRVS